MMEPIKSPFLPTLNLLDLSQLTSDPIPHMNEWKTIPTKLPSDIPNFHGRLEDDLSNHVMKFHLWCSSNSLVDDSIRLRLFQQTLIGTAVKWYIEFPRNTFIYFSYLTMVFLTHFQLPIHYETCTEFLTSLRKSTSTHISNHRHEWRRRQRLIKEEIPDQFLVDWFVKSLFPTLAKDVTMSGAMTEE